MKYIITERQYKVLTEDKERKILRVPGLEVFGDWEGLQAYLDKKGNPLFSVSGDLYLKYTNIISLDNLVSVSGNLDLERTKIKTLENLVSVGGFLDLTATQIKSLDNLVSVGGFLDLRNTNITSLGNLKYVGGSLYLRGTPLRWTTTRDDIRKQVESGEIIYL